MSTTQQSLDGRRVVYKAHNSILSHSYEMEINAKELQPSMTVYNDSFWKTLQNTLIESIDHLRFKLSAHGHQASAKKIRTMQALSIKTAVTEFRERCEDDPSLIQNGTEWDRFRMRIKDHSESATYTSTF